MSLSGHHGAVIRGNNVSTVRMCGCGVVHLSIGAVTLNLSPESFADLVQSLGRAHEEILQQAPTQAAQAPTPWTNVIQLNSLQKAPTEGRT